MTKDFIDFLIDRYSVFIITDYERALECDVFIQHWSTSDGDVYVRTNNRGTLYFGDGNDIAVYESGITDLIYDTITNVDGRIYIEEEEWLDGIEENFETEFNKWKVTHEINSILSRFNYR